MCIPTRLRRDRGLRTPRLAWRGTNSGSIARRGAWKNAADRCIAPDQTKVRIKPSHAIKPGDAKKKAPLPGPALQMMLKTGAPKRGAAGLLLFLRSGFLLRSSFL